MSKSARNLLVVVSALAIWGLSFLFYHPRPEPGPQEICLSNQSQIQKAKEAWAAQNQKPTNAVPTVQDLIPFLSEETLPHCPSGGTYTINPVAEFPTCSFPGHSSSNSGR